MSPLTVQEGGCNPFRFRLYLSSWLPQNDYKEEYLCCVIDHGSAHVNILSGTVFDRDTLFAVDLASAGPEREMPAI